MALQTSAPFDAAINTALIFTSDVFQVGILVMIIFLVAERLLRMNFNVLMLFVTLLVLFIGVANALSLQEIGSTLQLETFALSIDWIRSDPSIIAAYIGRRNILGAGILAGWCSIPFILTRLEAHHGEGHTRQHLVWSRIFRFVVTFLILGSAAFAYRIFGIDEMPLLVLSGVAAVLVPNFLPASMRLPYLTLAVKRSVLGGAVFAFVLSAVHQLGEAIRGLGSTGPLFDGYMLTVVASLLSAPTMDYQGLAPIPAEELSSQYNALVYPQRDESPPSDLLDLDPATLGPRHIVIVSLETAPMRYYRLFDDPNLPTLYRLSRQAIVSEHHYSNTPFTTNAAASILSGLYSAKDPIHRFPPQALPHVLARNGYRTSYVDAFLIDWRSGTSGHRRLYEGLGFQSLADVANIPGYEPRKRTFEYKSRMERKAIERVASAVLEAEAAEMKSMVFLQTEMGHFPWNAPEQHTDDSAADKIYGLAREYDKNIGLLIQRLDAAGLTDKSIIVITGDHGLRYNGEFQSLGLPFAHSDVAFNVPLIISAPGLVDRQVEVPFVTSHVDLAPTLLAMVGIPPDDMFYHGGNILSGAPADRVTYMMNTGLSPVDGLHWKGFFLTYDALRGVTESAIKPTRSDAQTIDQAIAQGQFIPKPLVQLETHFEDAKRVFALTMANFVVSPEQDTDK